MHCDLNCLLPEEVMGNMFGVDPTPPTFSIVGNLSREVVYSAKADTTSGKERRTKKREAHALSYIPAYRSAQDCGGRISSVVFLGHP
jgi:hypothetical protein